MTSRSRRQTRQRRVTPYYAWPEVHNASIGRRKAIRRAHEAWEARVRANTRRVAAEYEADRKAELEQQTAWADRMAALGFDMRDEHEALERGELVE